MEFTSDAKVTNWAKTYECRPRRLYEPETLADIKSILSEARGNGETVRVMGSGHSPSDIAMTDDVMISMRKMSRCVQVDTERATITIEAGMELVALNELLASHRLALPNMGAVSDVTVGGVISTGTHGTGVQHGIFSTIVIEFDLLTADGQVLQCSRTSNARVFQAAGVGLGALGIILSAKLQCERAFNLEKTLYGLSLSDVLDHLPVHQRSSDHFEFHWYPHTGNAVAHHIKRTEKLANRRKSWFWSYAMGYYLMELLFFVTYLLPAFVPYVNRFAYWLGKGPTSWSDRSDRVLNFDCLFAQSVSEWAIPAEETASALLDLEAYLEGPAGTSNRQYAHFPIEVRFVKADNFWLSPCYGRDTCYINIIMFHPYGFKVPIKRYWETFEKIMRKHRGRPHWAKAHSLRRQDFLQLYEKFDEFCKLCKELDPHGVFKNRYISQIID